MRKSLTDTVTEMKENAEKTAENLATAADPALTAVKEELQAAGKQAAPAVEKAKAVVTKELQEAKTKAEPYARKARQKAEPTLKAAAKKAEPTLKAAQSAGRAIAHTLVPEVFVQLGAVEFPITDIVDRCRNDFKASHKGGIHSCKVYIKPEDATAYYVINQVEGKLKL